MFYEDYFNEQTGLYDTEGVPCPLRTTLEEMNAEIQRERRNTEKIKAKDKYISLLSAHEVEPFKWQCTYITPFKLNNPTLHGKEGRKNLITFADLWGKYHELKNPEISLGVYPPTGTFTFIMTYTAFPPYFPEPETPEE